MKNPVGGPAFYSRGQLKIAEYWLDQPVSHPTECDLMLLNQYSRSPQGAFSSSFSTLTLDLTREEASLLEGLNRDTKYKVRRAETKDLIECVMEPTADDDMASLFTDFFNEFANGKGVARIVPAEFKARLSAGMLRFSRAKWNGQTVVWHVHIATADRASLLHSASHFRQADDNEVRAIIGRANRLLHWRDILTFKASGFKVYDFGGWYAGRDDETLLRINQFKEGFGGVRCDQVNSAVALSWRGRAYLAIRQLLSPAQRKALKLRIQMLRG